MKNKIKNWLLWIGILIVVITHIWMLFKGLPQSQIIGHAWMNLIAGILIFLGVKR